MVRLKESGLSTKEIASRLERGESTVSGHTATEASSVVRAKLTDDDSAEGRLDRRIFLSDIVHAAVTPAKIRSWYNMLAICNHNIYLVKFHKPHPLHNQCPTSLRWQ